MEKHSIYKNKLYFYFLSFSISSSGILFGFNYILFNIISIQYLDKQFNIIKNDIITDIQGNIILFYTLGAIFGSLTCTYIINYLGRKKSWLFFSVLNFLNSFLYLIPNLIVIYIAQFFVGIIVGIYIGVTNGIIIEYIPNEFRNFGIQTFNICIFGTIFITFALGYIFENYIKDYWFLFILGNAFIEFFRFIFMLIFLRYESPNYLYRLKKNENKKEILKYFNYIYKDKEVKKEYNKFVVEMEDLIALNGKINIRDLVLGKNRKGFLFASFMNFFQQAIGITLVTFFSTKFFYKISNDPYFWNFFVGWVFFASILLNLFFKRFNKKRMIILGSILLNLLMISMIIADLYSINTYLIISIFIYICLYAISFAGIFFEYLSKINEPEGMILSSTFRWIGTAIFGKLTPIFLDNLDIQGTLIIFISFLTIFSIIFIGFSIDIDNKDKIEIIRDLKSKKFYKKI